MNMDLFCPECGCPYVTVYEDESLECQGCGFFWHMYGM